MRGHLLVVAVFMLVSGCTGSSPTSPSSVPSPAPLPESIEIVSATAPAGATLTHTYCVLNWDFANCFEDLQLTFAVRSNRDASYTRLFTEFRTSDGRVCGETFMEAFQPVVAGVVSTFRTGPVYLKPDCFKLLPLQTVTVLARVTAVSPGVLLDLMKQEFSIGYTFAEGSP